MSSPTRPEGIEFHPISPKLIRVRIIGTLFLSAIGVAVSVVVGYFVYWGAYILAALIVVLAAWRIILIPRQVRALGYYEGESDFLITRGIMFQELTVIPYGRIQYVEISEDPVARHYGISEIVLHTASSETSGRLHGLTRAEASRLRDVLASRGAAEHAGL